MPKPPTPLSPQKKLWVGVDSKPLTTIKQFITCPRCALVDLLTDLQLSLNAALAALSVVRLRGVVLRHHLDELPRQRGVLGKRGRRRRNTSSK